MDITPGTVASGIAHHPGSQDLELPLSAGLVVASEHYDPLTEYLPACLYLKHICMHSVQLSRDSKLSAVLSSAFSLNACCPFFCAGQTDQKTPRRHKISEDKGF